jgi:hypothetical protein
MTMIARQLPRLSYWRRAFSSTAARHEILDAESLPNRIIPRYQGTPIPRTLASFIDRGQKVGQATFSLYSGHLPLEISS